LAVGAHQQELLPLHYLQLWLLSHSSLVPPSSTTFTNLTWLAADFYPSHWLSCTPAIQWQPAFFFLLNFFFCRLFHPLRVWIVAVTTTRRAEYKHRMLEAEHGNPGCRDWFFVSFSMYCKIAYFSDIKIAWVWITVCASEFWCLPSYLWHGKERCEKI
jgi:hypothetical protein